MRISDFIEVAKRQYRVVLKRTKSNLGGAMLKNNLVSNFSKSI